MAVTASAARLLWSFWLRMGLGRCNEGQGIGASKTGPVQPWNIEIDVLSNGLSYVIHQLMKHSPLSPQLSLAPILYLWNSTLTGATQPALRQASSRTWLSLVSQFMTALANLCAKKPLFPHGLQGSLRLLPSCLDLWKHWAEAAHPLRKEN